MKIISKETLYAYTIFIGSMAAMVAITYNSKDSSTVVYQQGLRMMSYEFWHGASEKFSSAIAIDSQKAEYYQYRAFCYSKLKKYVAANNDYDMALSKQTKPNIDVYNEKAFVLIKLGTWDSVVIYANKALVLDSANAEAWRIKGIAAVEAGDLYHAEDFFQKSISIAKTPEALMSYTRLLLKLNKPNEALECANKVILLDSTSSIAYSNRAIIKNVLKMNKLSIQKDIMVSLKLDVFNANAYYAQGYLFETEDNWQQALSSYEKSYSIDSSKNTLNTIKNIKSDLKDNK